MLDEAAKGGYGVGAFNVNNMEQIQAIMEAARGTKSPVVIQASRGARKYSNDKFLYHLMLAAAELYPEIPLALHLDHGNGFDTCKSAIELGFTSVMIDGSLLEDGKTPSDFKYNTGCDALAVAIGTSHGAYKFASKPTEAVLKISLIRKIHQLLPTTHLVMHGSSSVPQELRDQVNKYGGSLKPAWGVPVEEIQEGIRNGVRKINVDTDSRLAITGAIRKVFVETPEKFDPRDYLKPAREAMQKVVEARMNSFGQAGRAGDYQPKSLEEMRALYRGGARGCGGGCCCGGKKH
jgi:fructose-bisphosphate aldolase class II